MISSALIRQYAVGQNVSQDVADKEIVLHYVLALLNEGGLIGPNVSEGGYLLFKGGTALRKCVFGGSGRFSIDIDLDATRGNGFEVQVEELFSSPYHEIDFSIANFRYSDDGNFGAEIDYEHPYGKGSFELQISYRDSTILDPVHLPLLEQSYFRYTEFDLQRLASLDPYEMIGEKIMALNRRVGGSGKDVYDLYLWVQSPYSKGLVRLLAALKAWTDRSRKTPYEPTELLDKIRPANFQWEELKDLVPRDRASEPERICTLVHQRLGFLADLSDDERLLVDDQTAHREQGLFESMTQRAKELARRLPR